MRIELFKKGTYLGNSIAIGNASKVCKQVRFTLLQPKSKMMQKIGYSVIWYLRHVWYILSMFPLRIAWDIKHTFFCALVRTR